MTSLGDRMKNNYEKAYRYKVLMTKTQNNNFIYHIPLL
jgi:hypothetical protein